MKLFRDTKPLNAAQELVQRFYLTFGKYPHPPVGQGVERARKREAAARHPNDDPLTRGDRFAQHNMEVDTRQCRRARQRREAKALIARIKSGSKNPAALGL